MGAFDYSILRMFWFSAAQSGARHTKDPRLCTHAAAQQSTRAQRACRDKTKETARTAQPRTRNQIKRAPALAAAPRQSEGAQTARPLCRLYTIYSLSIFLLLVKKMFARRPAAAQPVKKPPRAAADCRKSQKASPSADMRRRRRHRQGNFAANCVRGTQ